MLAVNYQPEIMVTAMHEVESKYNIKIHFSIEDEPLGTAGPISLARDILGADDSPFFVLNSDVICEFPFKQLLDFHKAHGAEGTLMTTPVKDPSKYGVIISKTGTTIIEKFVEKPTEFVGDQINAGIYIFNPSVLSRISHVNRFKSRLNQCQLKRRYFQRWQEMGSYIAFHWKGFGQMLDNPRIFSVE